MRLLYSIALFIQTLVVYGQDQNALTFEKDSLLNISANPSKGFYHDYLIFIPKGTPIHSTTYLLVEPNNTGLTSDSIEIHYQAAVDLASKSSVGNNVSTNLNIPLLVPVFPRPEAQPLVYTHALDRDVILEQNKMLKRLDLQLIAMIEHAQNVLKTHGILVHDQCFMNGFSASATFTNRFVFIHPEKVKAAVMGGLNGILMLPNKKVKNKAFNYPLGTNDFKTIFNKPFDFDTYKAIPQFIYMGQQDNNDAVQYDDAYSTEEQFLIKSILGEDVQNRWIKCQNLYTSQYLSPIFNTYKDVGHWTTSSINLEVSKFFLKHLQN